MSMKTKTLLIGCGGSGIKTLIRLNQLMSTRTDFRPDIKENISYFVLDTDQKDLTKFETEIQTQMGSKEMMPVIRSVSLSGGVRRLSKLVEPIAEAAKDKEIAAEMQKYWWHNAEGEPFIGYWLKDMKEGAGQCCQVSYISAWKSMPEIKLKINSLLEDIRVNDQGQRDHFEGFKVYIVAGFAGGTGRGSWTLVAFKIRQCLLEHGVDVPLDGMFFDGSCYPTVSQKESLRLNSLTAFSELSAWIRLKRKADPSAKLFSLPSLDAPRTAPPDIDLARWYKVDPELYCPFESSFVTFGENGKSARLGDNDEYHNMAAAALYAKIVNTEIASVDNNDRYDIGSFATTTFEVDSYRIQRYLETAAQKLFLEKQFDKENDEALTAEVMQWIGTAKPAKASDEELFEEPFLDKYHLRVPVPNIDLAGSCNMAWKDKSSQFSLLQAMMRSLSDPETGIDSLKRKAPDSEDAGSVITPDNKQFGITASFRDELAPRSADADSATAWVTEAFKLEEVLEENEIKVRFKRILEEAKLDGKNLRMTLHDLVMKQFAPKNKRMSLRRAVLFVKELKRVFSASVQTLAGGVSFTGENNPCKNVEDLVKSFERAIVKEADLDFKDVLKGGGFWARRFNDDEIKVLGKKFDACVYAAVFFRMKKCLGTFFKRAVDELDRLERCLREMDSLLEASSQKLNENLKGLFKEEENVSYEEMFDHFFIDDSDQTGRAVREAIPEAASLKNLYYRQLKPILSREKMKALLTDEGNVSEEALPILECIKEALDQLLALDGEGEYSSAAVTVKTTIPETISSTIKRYVALKIDDDGRTFMDRNFSFDQVLEANIPKWNELIHTTLEGDSRSVLFDRLRHYLGLDDRIKDDYAKNPQNKKFEVIEKNKLVTKMARSLVVTCNPWVRFREGSDLARNLPYCLVILPINVSAYEQDLIDAIKDLYGVQDDSWAPHILYPGSGSSNCIPLNRILVYTSTTLGAEGGNSARLDEIQSLDGWKDYREKLELAEDLDHKGASVFELNADGRTWKEIPKSFSYLAPFFTEEPYSNLRWHPWIDDIEKERKRHTDICRALFYALLGHDVEGKLGPVQKALAGKNFVLPLLKMEKELSEEEKKALKFRSSKSAKSANQLFYFLRGQVEWLDGEITEVTDTAWKKGKLENSINHVFEFLGGQGSFSRKTEESKSEGKEICKALLKEAQLFEDKIRKKIGEDLYGELVRQCVKWIIGQRNGCKEEADKQYWVDLAAFAQEQEDLLKQE